MEIIKNILRILGVLLMIFLFLIIVGSGLGFLIQVPFMLLFGWIGFLGKAFPYITFNPLMVFEGIGTILVLILGVHFFLSWFYKNYRTSTQKLLSIQKNIPSTHLWQIRWTLTSVCIFILMFLTSIAMTGSIHQVAWLAHEQWSKMDYRFGMTLTTRDMEELGKSLESYRVDNQHFPITSGSISLEQAGIPAPYLVTVWKPYYDSWGTPYQYTSDGHSYVLRSYGYNEILGGGTGLFDDIVYSDGRFIASGHP